MRWVRGYRWWQRLLAGAIAGVAMLWMLSGCAPESRMDKDWKALTDSQRTLVCKLYIERPEADFSGAAEDLGWELGTMMRFLAHHC
jgi:hypothetical protein